MSVWELARVILVAPLAGATAGIIIGGLIGWIELELKRMDGE